MSSSTRGSLTCCSCTVLSRDASLGFRAPLLRFVISLRLCCGTTVVAVRTWRCCVHGTGYYVRSLEGFSTPRPLHRSRPRPYGAPRPPASAKYVNAMLARMSVYSVHAHSYSTSSFSCWSAHTCSTQVLRCSDCSVLSGAKCFWVQRGSKCLGALGAIAVRVGM